MQNDVIPYTSSTFLHTPLQYAYAVILPSRGNHVFFLFRREKRVLFSAYEFRLVYLNYPRQTRGQGQKLIFCWVKWNLLFLILTLALRGLSTHITEDVTCSDSCLHSSGYQGQTFRVYLAAWLPCLIEQDYKKPLKGYVQSKQLPRYPMGLEVGDSKPLPCMNS